MFIPFSFFSPPAGDIPPWPALATESEITTFLTSLTSSGAPTIEVLSGYTINNSLAGVLAANGNIYTSPWLAGQVGKLDPDDDSLIGIGANYTGSALWAGGCLHTNEDIYFAPRNATGILVVDPANDTSSIINPTGFPTGSGKYNAAIMGRNEKIYFLPAGEDNVGVYEPSTDTWSTITENFPTGSSIAYFGGTLAPNGNIYCFPYDADDLMVINPNDDTISIVDLSSLSLSGNAKYSTSALGADGKVYAVPRAENEVIVLDPADNSFTTFGDIGGATKTLGATIGGDGNVYAAGAVNFSKTFIIDTFANTFTSPDTNTNGQRGFTMAQNGAIYSFSFTGGNIVKVTPSATLPSGFSDFALSPYVNNF